MRCAALGFVFVLSLLVASPVSAQVDEPENLLFYSENDFEWRYAEVWEDEFGDGGGEIYVECGQLMNGSDGAFSYFGYLSLGGDGRDEGGDVCPSEFTLAYSDRGFIMDPFQSWNTELTTVRQIYVPADSDFSRWADRITNDADSDEDTTITYSGSLSWFDIAVYDSSSGDDEVDDQDNWAVVDDAQDGDGMPAIAVVWQSADAETKASRVDIYEWGSFSASFDDVTIPAGDTVTMVLFAVQANTRAEAAVLAEELSGLDGAGSDELDDDMDTLVNFVPSAPGAPRVHMNGPYAVQEGAATVVHAAAEDLEGDSMTYEWDLDGDEVYDDLVGTLDAPVSAANVDGPASIRLGLRVTDSAGHVVTRHVSIGVQNVAPEVQSAPVTAARTGEPYSYQIVATDFPNDTLSYTIDEGPTGMTVSRTGLVEWTPPADGRGPQIPVVIVVSDDDEGAVDHGWSISMSGAPFLQDGGPYEVGEGGEILLSPTASDPEDDPVTFAWDLDGNGVYDDSREQAVTWSAAGIDGPDRNFRVRLVITDGEFEVATSIPINVENVPPQFLSQPPPEAVVDREWVYALEIVDPGDDSFTVELDEEDAPEGLVLDETNTLRWTPDDSDLETGEFTFRLTAKDEDNGREHQDVVIHVRENTPPPVPPIAFPDGNEPVRTNAPTIILENVDDPDGDPLQYFIEVDHDVCFCSPERQASPALAEGDLVTQWTVAPLDVATHTKWYVRRWTEDGLAASNKELSLFDYEAPAPEPEPDVPDPPRPASCACRSAGAPVGSGSSAAGIALSLGLGLILARRRRAG